MSFINNSMLSGFGNAEQAAYGPPSGGAFGGGELLPAQSDGIALAPQYGGGGGYGGGLYGGPSSGSTGLGGFAGIMNGFMSMLSNALNSLAGMLGGGTSTTAPSQPQQQQTYFTNASASSVGDPHDAFEGTTGQGTPLDSKWNSMQGHQNLLNSDSFAGGYRVSTTTTPPAANGVTYNATATVATNCGATDVTLNANGSYAVTENGQNIALTKGQATSLGANESVTLGADGSLTIAETSAQGGSIDTTLKANGSGVDVQATASNVDLGGYLVRHTDGGAASTAFPPYGNGFVGSPFGTFTNQLGASNSSLTDVQQLLGNDVAAL